jgi:hypothetical protein
MALEKNLDTKHGLKAKYWRITGYQEILDGPDIEKADYQLSGYSTKTQRDNKKHPLEKKHFTLSQAYKDNMSGAYNEIKTVEVEGIKIFDGAIDV